MSRSFSQSQSSLHESANPKFYWNREMYSDFLTWNVPPSWFAPIIQGCIGSFTEVYGQTTFSLVLISRRSCYMAGTRYNARGLDDLGHAANFVESEQLLYVNRTWFSFLQIRGSVPVFWHQTGVISAPVELTRSEESTAPAFLKHFQGLIEEYERVMVVNLLSKKRKEDMLTGCYEALMRRYWKTLEPFVCVFAFDYQKECKHNRHFQLGKLLTMVHEMLTYYGFYSCGQFHSLQKGVPRINCLDCLDRTNVVMARFGWETLLQQLSIYQIQVQLDYDATKGIHPMLKAFKNMWADTGDMLSKQYTGTGSVSSMVTRDGRKGIRGLISHGMKTVGRILSAADERNQDSIDIVLSAPNIVQPVADAWLQKIAVHVCTWNLSGDESPVTEIRDWLIDPHCPSPHFLVVGFQELVKLGPKSILSNNSKRLLEAWNERIIRMFQEDSVEYRLVQSVEMLGCAMSVFAMEALLPNITAVEMDTVKEGFGNTVGNKGAVLLRLNFFDSSLCFLNCYLKSGEENIEVRMKQLKDIHIRGFQEKRKVPPVAHHDVKLLFGDLNFRLSLDNSKIRRMCEDQSLSELRKFDQLLRMKRHIPVLDEYTEGELTFLPTFKYDKHSQEYDTSRKMRAPAWCDRVLYAGNGIELLSYTRSENRHSCHRPVSATVIIPILQHRTTQGVTRR